MDRSFGGQARLHPNWMIIGVTPIFLWGRLRFPRGLLYASQWLTLPFFIAVMLAWERVRPSC